MHILRDLAVADVGDFARTSLVCKRFAYLVATEQRIWRTVCLGNEVGFGGMHYSFQKVVNWKPLSTEEGDEVASSDTEEERGEEMTKLMAKTLWNGNWRGMFRERPRIRFNGCYISTVNYVRAGVANANHITWNSAVHIVTYYRYLRFFRDGTVISLLTTSEPTEIVHHLTRSILAAPPPWSHPDRATNLATPQPVVSQSTAATLQHALRGRWKLSSGPPPSQGGGDAGASSSLGGYEGDLRVETEGVGGNKYIYVKELSLRSSGKRSGRNNKLVWRSHWSWNRLTDDVGEFGLKNDKPFFFSRVGSYGTGS